MAKFYIILEGGKNDEKNKNRVGDRACWEEIQL